MDEKQIDFIEKLLKDGKSLGWIDTNSIMHKILKIVPSIEDEPSRCATLLGGGYIALWNVDPSDIIVFKHLF